MKKILIFVVGLIIVAIPFDTFAAKICNAKMVAFDPVRKEYFGCRCSGSDEGGKKVNAITAGEHDYVFDAAPKMKRCTSGTKRFSEPEYRLCGHPALRHAKGAGTGAGVGAGTGAAIGSVIPGIGTIIGAAIGATAGAITGAVGTANEAKKAGDLLKSVGFDSSLHEWIPNINQMCWDYKCRVGYFDTDPETSAVKTGSCVPCNGMTDTIQGNACMHVECGGGRGGCDGEIGKDCVVYDGRCMKVCDVEKVAEQHDPGGYAISFKVISSKK